MSLSVVVNTRNMADTLKRTLESIKSIADEIVVVDMKSTDDTVKVAKKYTKKVFTFEKELGFADPARNFALSKATQDWILVLDADEEIEKPLATLFKTIAKGEVTHIPVADAYWVARKNIIFGKWIEHTGWGSDYQLRFFRRGQVQWTDKVHTHPVAEGRVDKFPPDEKYSIIHHNYQSIEQFIERLNRYTRIQSTQTDENQKPITSATILEAFANEFLRRYFVFEGTADGVHGLSLSLLQGMYEAIVVMKQWEKHNFPQSANDHLQAFTSLREMQKNIAYWIADWYVRNTDGLPNLYWRIRRKMRK